MKVRVTITIDKQILSEIDQKRGLATRSILINEMLKQVIIDKKAKDGEKTK